MPRTPGRRPRSPGKPAGTCGSGWTKAGRCGSSSTTPWPSTARYINNKSAPLPEGENVRPELERFLRRLGYRLVLKELKHPAQFATGDKLQLAMKWQNVGSAPCYKPYRLAYRLANDQGYEKVFVGTVTVNQWLPGSIELFTEEFFKEPTDLPPGEVIDVADSIQLARRSVAGNLHLVHCRRRHGRHQADCAIGNQGPIRGWMVSVEHSEHFPIRERAGDMSGAVSVL